MMGQGNKRGTKRVSSTSTYTSTITTVVFIAMCVIGVWMVTNNSLGPPRTGESLETPQTTNSLGQTQTANSLEQPQTTTTTTTTTNKLSSDKKDQTTGTIFEDNPGYLPNDAIQSDDPKQNDNAAEAAAVVAAGGDKKEPEGIVSGGVGGGKNEEAKADQELSVDEQVKQKEGQTQISEESTLTQNEQEVDQNQETMIISQDSQNQQQEQDPDEEQQQQQQQNTNEIIKQQLQEDAGKQTADISNENQISDEDNRLRIEQHDEEQKQILHEKQENPQNPDETNTEPKENPTQQAMQTDEQQNATTTQEPDKYKADHQSIKTQSKTKSERTKEHKAAASNPDEPVLETTATKPGIPKESTESKKSWSTQAKQSANEKERREDESKGKESIYGYTWHLCNESTGPDFIPCLDNAKALKKLHSTRHYEHRERHCPEEGPTCLVPLPEGYKKPIKWPHSRDKIWYRNVPHSSLADVKGHQNWVKVTGEFLTFPGGGTQFIHGALHYIDVIQEAVPDIAWGKNTRVVLDVGCGVASFGGYLFDRDVLTMSFAPKDEHEAQVQFALERGIPAISAVMGTQRLLFPSKVFDLVHCARCRVPWHIDGGKLLLELNRVLRPGGYFVWSATPVYQKLEEDVQIWKAMSSLTVSMCWELVTIKMDKINSAGFAVYRKPTTDECYEKRKENNPPMCKDDDDPNAAWYVPLQACLHRLTVNEDERGSKWPKQWPPRLRTPPYWLNKSQMGIYGKPAPEDFAQDYKHWKRVVRNTYMNELGISWSDVRSIMDMRAVYGGFAAALKDLQVWVMNVVNIDSPDTLPLIYERGLFGIYHDWCESFSTYPRTYDLLHADHLFSKLRKKCKLAPVMAEVDRIVRPGGKLIVRDESSTIGEIENLLKSLRWEVHLTFSKDQEGLLSAQKGNWRPDTIQAAF